MSAVLRISLILTKCVSEDKFHHNKRKLDKSILVITRPASSYVLSQYFIQCVCFILCKFNFWLPINVYLMSCLRTVRRERQ